MDNRYILGIDVGTSTIKVFIGTRTMDGSVSIAGSGIMPTAGFVKGIITDVEALAMSISQAVECAVMATDISVKDAYIGFGGMEIQVIKGTGIIAPASIQTITSEDICRVYGAAILASISDEEQALHVVPQWFFVDGKKQASVLVGQRCATLKVEAQIITMPKVVVSQLTDAIKRVGINVLGIVANSILSTQLLPASGTQKKLFLDIGAGTTELVIYNDNQIDFSLSLPLGGHYITSDIMQGLNITYHHAEEIKKYYAKLDKNLCGQNIILDCNNYGTTDKQCSYDFLYDIIESRIEEIVYLIHDSLKSNLGGENIEKIFVTGGCGAMPNLVDRIETTFGIPVEVVILKELQSEYTHPSNTACYGVLTYAVHHLTQDQGGSGVKNRKSLIGRLKDLFYS